jgi:hypothetical protein
LPGSFPIPPLGFIRYYLVASLRAGVLIGALALSFAARIMLDVPD